MDGDALITWRMKGGLVPALIVTIVVTSFLGINGYHMLRDRPWQPRPDLVNGIMGGGLALLGVGVVGVLWISVLRAALLGLR